MDLKSSSTANFTSCTCVSHNLRTENVPLLRAARDTAGARGRGWTEILNELKENRMLVDER